MFKETRFRSVVKAVSYRFVGSMATALIAFVLIRRLDVALTVGAFDVAVKVVVYFIHERVWDRIKFGKRAILPSVVWITGLSGSGKTTIAKLVIQELITLGMRVEHLDGETVRDMFPDTGFSPAEVNEHIERAGHLASLLERNGVFVVASFISPFDESRRFVRKLCRNFILVHLSTPVEECERRDLKGLYARARRGEIHSVAGIDVAYESPVDAHLVIDTSRSSLEEARSEIMNVVRARMEKIPDGRPILDRHAN